MTIGSNAGLRRPRVEDVGPVVDVGLRALRCRCGGHGRQRYSIPRGPNRVRIVTEQTDDRPRGRAAQSLRVGPSTPDRSRRPVRSALVNTRRSPDEARPDPRRAPRPRSPARGLRRRRRRQPRRHRRRRPTSTDDTPTDDTDGSRRRTLDRRHRPARRHGPARWHGRSPAARSLPDVSLPVERRGRSSARSFPNLDDDQISCLADNLGRRTSTRREVMDAARRVQHPDHRPQPAADRRMTASTPSGSTPAACWCCPTRPCSGRCSPTTAARPTSTAIAAPTTRRWRSSRRRAPRRGTGATTTGPTSRSVGVADRRRRGGRRRCSATPARPPCGAGRSPTASPPCAPSTRRACRSASCPTPPARSRRVLRRSGVCQVGPGAGVAVRCVVDSHVVGVAKPDPAIFDHAVAHFAGVDRAASPTSATR